MRAAELGMVMAFIAVLSVFAPSFTTVISGRIMDSVTSDFVGGTDIGPVPVLDMRMP